MEKNQVIFDNLFRMIRAYLFIFYHSLIKLKKLIILINLSQDVIMYWFLCKAEEEEPKIIVKI